jgi:hypothetical protein
MSGPASQVRPSAAGFPPKFGLDVYKPHPARRILESPPQPHGTRPDSAGQLDTGTSQLSEETMQEIRKRSRSLLGGWHAERLEALIGVVGLRSATMSHDGDHVY